MIYISKMIEYANLPVSRYIRWLKKISWSLWIFYMRALGVLVFLLLAAYSLALWAFDRIKSFPDPNRPLASG